MNLFGPRKVVDADARAQVERLADEVRRMQSSLRTFETEQQTMHDQVRKWMRRAVAAERVAERAHPEPGGGTLEQAPAPAPLWGPRQRRLARLARRDPAEEVESNGVHP